MDDQEKLEEMMAFSAMYDDLPDGAFFALAEEQEGWNTDDWVWYSENVSDDTDR